MLYMLAELSPRIWFFTRPLAGPRGANPYFFCMSSGISSRRRASICHCGEPWKTESLPQMTLLAPSPLIHVPSIAAANLGSITHVVAKLVHLGVDVVGAALVGHPGELGHPLDVTCLVE